MVFFGFPAVDVTALARHWLVFEEPPAGYRFANDVPTGASAGHEWAAATLAQPVRVLIRGDSLRVGGQRMTADLGVLLPIRIETRFKNGDLWLRVVPDEPWFVRDDPRITPGELDALRRYAAAPADPAPGVPAAWRDLAAQVGAPRAVYLHRTFITAAADGTPHRPHAAPAEQRTGPALPRIAGFPGRARRVGRGRRGAAPGAARCTVDRARLLADFADPDQPGDRRWWEDWDEAVAVGVAGIIPAASLTAPVDALYVTGLGDGDPAELFAGLAADGRVGLLAPGPAHQQRRRRARRRAGHRRRHLVGRPARRTPATATGTCRAALTGDPARLGHLPGGDQAHRAPASALVTALWPALWGFTASQVFDVARGRAPASWAARGAVPRGRVPDRAGRPAALRPAADHRVDAAGRPTTATQPLEAPLVQALLVLRARHAASAPRPRHRSRQGHRRAARPDRRHALVAHGSATGRPGRSSCGGSARSAPGCPARGGTSRAPGRPSTRWPDQLGAQPAAPLRDTRRVPPASASRSCSRPAPRPPTCRACSARSPTPR